MKCVGAGIDQSPGKGTSQKVMLCSLCPPRAPGVPCNTVPVGHYWAQVGDDCSFCVFGGPGKQWPDSPAAPLPALDKAYWCASRGPCKTNEPPQLQFPTDCTLKSWQGMGRDLHSVVGDPKIKGPETGDWTLDPGSPALALGFEQLNVTDVGPRVA
jgi:hypothetical protein